VAETGLTEDGYRAELKKLGLHPSGASTGKNDFYRTRDGSLQAVPQPDFQTPQQRRETIEKLKLQLGIGVFRG
jgi:hypothetical protein